MNPVEEHRREVKTNPVYIVCAALRCVDHTDYEHQPKNINSGLLFVDCDTVTVLRSSI